MKSYVIINEIDITDVMIQDSLNTEHSYRKSLDGTKAVLKFATGHPNCMEGYQKYTCAEIIVELEGLVRHDLETTTLGRDGHWIDHRNPQNLRSILRCKH